jgi:hypothetical protein
MANTTQMHDVAAAPGAAVRHHPSQFAATHAQTRRRRAKVGCAQDQTSWQPGVIVVVLLLWWPLASIPEQQSCMAYV